MKISIGCDHAGYEYKQQICLWLEKHGMKVTDHGTFSPDSVDYPDFVHPAASSVENGTNDLGILICGSGQGVSITANKHQQIRCALCWDTELAALAKQHNNANMVAIPARFISSDLAINIVETFLNTEFEGGRHQKRVDKIPCC